MQTKDDGGSGLKYVLAIVVCQLVLLMSWFSLGPDMSLMNFDSVNTLLNSLANEQPQHPGYLLGSHAIRQASRDVNILSLVVIGTSLGVLWFSGLVAFRLRRNYAAGKNERGGSLEMAGKI